MKPIEIERTMVAARATEEDINEARQGLNEGMRREHPGYRYSSERIERNGKLLRILRTYQYSRWEAFKLKVFSLFSRDSSPCIDTE
jgi:hypothetical protein